MIKKNKGFTLIELLIVIAIVGLAVTFTVYSINVARIKARDAKRLGDIKQIKKALELYFDDHNAYPNFYAYTSSSNCGTNWCNLENVLKPYLKSLPRDPAGLQTAYRFYYDSESGDNNQTYGLMVRLEYRGNFPIAANDGGYYSGSGAYYELGNQPSYCKSKYTGGSSNWFNDSSTTNVCVGGN